MFHGITRRVQIRKAPAFYANEGRVSNEFARAVALRVKFPASHDA